MTLHLDLWVAVQQRVCAKDDMMTDLPNTQPDSRATTVMDAPDKKISVRDLFGIDSDMMVPAFSEADERVPDLEDRKSVG